MKRNVIYTIVLVAMLALATSACKGMSGSTVGGASGDGTAGAIPTSEAQLTDVGNPEETDEYLKTYINPEFEVKIEYPGSWDLVEHGTAEADFTSEDVDLVATFEWLKDDTFESFLGDITALIEVPTKFDKTLCAEAVEADENTLEVTCHHYFDYGAGKSFIATVKGLISKSSVGFKAEPFGVKVLPKHVTETLANTPHPTIVGGEASSDDGNPKVLPKPPKLVKPVIKTVIGN
jgi:hypothetical protein